MKPSRKPRTGEVESPCVKKCSLDSEKVCPACFRSIDEIIAWTYADNAVRRKILESAQLRRNRIKR